MNTHNKEKIALRPVAILSNDSSTYELERTSFVFSFFDQPTEFHSESTTVGPGKTIQFRAKTKGHCSGMFCIAEASLPNASTRLLFGRTEFFGEGSWDTNVFTVSGDLREQPCGFKNVEENEVDTRTSGFQAAAVCETNGSGSILPQTHIWLFRADTGDLLYGMHARGESVKWQRGRVPAVSATNPLVLIGAGANVNGAFAAVSDAWFECGGGAKRKIYVCTGSPAGVAVIDSVCPL